MTLQLRLNRHEVWKIHAALSYYEAGRTPPRGLMFHVEQIMQRMTDILEVTHGADALTLDSTDTAPQEGLGRR